MFRPLPAFRPTPLRRKVCAPHSHATIPARSTPRSGRRYRPGRPRRRRRPPARGTIWHLPPRRRSPATACAPVCLRATPTARPSSARSSLNRRRGASGRREGAARITLQNRPRGLASRLEIVGARRLLQCVVQHGGLRGLRALIPHPPVPTSDSREHERRAEEDRAAVVLPPGFESCELLL